VQAVQLSVILIQLQGWLVQYRVILQSFTHFYFSVQMVASVSLGAAHASILAARNHLHERKQFGKQLKDFQVHEYAVANVACCSKLAIAGNL
jgi:alkylation response protein AidB-like acyl-CoA dehydrogenase